MAIIKCKMCGGTLNLVEGASTAECEYCGSVQTVPKADDEKKLTLFARANRLRIACDFDKAAGIYEAIVADFPEEAEAYWGLVLCKYGIEYVDDPATGKKIPTCHCSDFDSVMKDSNVELAQEYADVMARRLYREEAKQIEELRKSIIAVSANEDPYDVFICYKETDFDGKRTLDSVLAMDIYEALADKGYRVFFSRITLEDKLGTEYEPYIFAALNSAKIMLVIGTDFEYFNAVWVKNEWSRFLKLMAQDKSKHLIPCFKGIDAYDMPEEFARLQAQDLGKMGAIQDIVHGVQKLLPKQVQTTKETVVVQQAAPSNPSVDSYLKRAFMFLEDGDWNAANEYCEKVLDVDPENARAYLGKLMSEQKVKKQEDLNNCANPFGASNSCQKAFRFGDEELKAALFRYNENINTRNKNAHLESVYTQAVSKLQKAESEDDYKEAMTAFKSIAGYKDSDQLAKKASDDRSKCVQLFKQYKQCLQSGNRVEEKKLAAEKELKRLQGQYRSLCALKSVWSKENEEKGLLLSQKLATLQSELSKLNAEKKNLGLFDGKKKRAINEKIKPVEEEEKVVLQELEVIDKKKQGFATFADLCSTIDEIQRQIESHQKEIQELNTQTIEAIQAELNNYRLGRTLMALYNKFHNIQVGSSVKFGKYEQYKNSTSKADVEWLVLAKEYNRVLLVSKYALAHNRFNERNQAITWQTCSLRSWLNADFIQNVFSSEEKAMLATVTVTADPTPGYDTNPGRPTQDRVFLLSAVEAARYFKYDSARACKPTEYAKEKGVHTEQVTGNCLWWLRSPGYNDYHVAFVKRDGSIATGGNYSDERYYGVRPAIWVNING